MEPVRVILVGGFLGAGKTTLLARASEHLASQGTSVGLVTNDQVAGLVDTANLSGRGFSVREVAGGCFCCRYPDLVEAVESLVTEAGARTVLAEPVGSCTDLLATVSRPLQRLLGERLQVAPLTAVVDAQRLPELWEEAGVQRLPEEVRYIFRTQLEEADIIVLNKSDLLRDADAVRLRERVAHAFPRARILAMSARSGDGVAEWLERVCADDASHRPTISVDYEIYAAGEAALGWLNATADLSVRSAPDWQEFQEQLLEAVGAACHAAGAEIAHVKTALSCGGGTLLASVTTTGGPVTSAVVGPVDLDALRARLVFNARAHIAPDELGAAFERALRQTAGQRVAIDITNRTAIRPGRPVPVHRLLDVLPA